MADSTDTSDLEVEEPSPGNRNLRDAKRAKNDEFYTRLTDIEIEMSAYYRFNPDVFRDKTVLLPCDDPEWSNFTKFFASSFNKLGLKKLISTSYAPDSKNMDLDYEPPALEVNDPRFDETKSHSLGKKFTLERKDVDGLDRVSFDDIEWEYLEGDGDFRSDEVTALRDEVDIVVTNPPFSLFREFITWLMDGRVSFSVIGSKNAISYKEVFPLIKDNKVWLGNGFRGGDSYFSVPSSFKDTYADGVYDEDTGLVHFRNVTWFTNLDLGNRHEFLDLRTWQGNLEHGSKKIKTTGYRKYDNYDAIEVPEVKSIPSDYEGVMGVPITFLDRYNPDQFEILGSRRWGKSKALVALYTGDKTAETDFKTTVDGKETYDRIFIKFKKPRKG